MEEKATTLYPALSQQAPRYVATEPYAAVKPPPDYQLTFEKPDPTEKAERPVLNIVSSPRKEDPAPQYAPPPPSAPRPSDSEITVRDEMILGAPTQQRSWFSSLFSKKPETLTVKVAIQRGMAVEDIKERFGCGPSKDIFGACLQSSVSMNDFMKARYEPIKVAHLLSYEEAVQLQLSSEQFGPTGWNIIAFSRAFRQEWPNVMSDLRISLLKGLECGVTTAILRSARLSNENVYNLEFGKDTIARMQLSPFDVKKILGFNSWKDLVKGLGDLDSKDIEELSDCGWNARAQKIAFPDYKGEPSVKLHGRQPQPAAIKPAAKK